MSTVIAPPFSGTFRAQPEPSTFVFAVRHSGVFCVPWHVLGRRGNAARRTATRARARGARACRDPSPLPSPPRCGAERARAASSSTPRTIPRSAYRSTAIRFAARATAGGRKSTASSRSAASPGTVSATGHYARPRAERLRRGDSRACGCAPPSTAASSDSTGRPSCRAVATAVGWDVQLEHRSAAHA